MFHTKGTIQIETDYEMFKDLSKVLFNYAATVDASNNKIYLALDANENQKELITLAAYLEKESGEV